MNGLQGSRRGSDNTSGTPPDLPDLVSFDASGDAFEEDSPFWSYSHVEEQVPSPSGLDDGAAAAMASLEIVRLFLLIPFLS